LSAEHIGCSCLIESVQLNKDENNRLKNTVRIEVTNGLTLIKVQRGGSTAAGLFLLIRSDTRLKLWSCYGQMTRQRRSRAVSFASALHA
jgi:hypothetical protein